MRLFFKTNVAASLDKVKAGFNRDLFLELSPPWVKIKLNRFDGCSQGDEVHLDMVQFGLRQNWISQITENTQTDKMWQFVDEGRKLPWPLNGWRHVHRVEALNQNQSTIVDDIQFTTSPFFMAGLLYPALWATFAIRPKRYKKFFKTV